MVAFIRTSEVDVTLLPHVSKAVKLLEIEYSNTVFKNTQFFLRALYTATPLKASTPQIFGLINFMYNCKFVDTVNKNLELGMSNCVMKHIKDYL
jgi:hypothetical protein